MKVELFYDKYVLSTVILNADCFSREERIADQSDSANDENNELDDKEASDWGRSDENLLDLGYFEIIDDCDVFKIGIDMKMMTPLDLFVYTNI